MSNCPEKRKLADQQNVMVIQREYVVLLLLALLVVLRGVVCFVLTLLMATNGIPGSSWTIIPTRLDLDNVP